MAIIKIPDGNAFKLRVTAMVNDVPADLNVVNNIIVNFVRRGRIAQPFGIDGNGRLVIANDGSLARGLYGVELTGYHDGKPWRHYIKNAFKIVDENEDADTPTVVDDVPVYDISDNMNFGGDGVTAEYVNAAISAHDGDENAHPEIQQMITEAVEDLREEIEEGLVEAGKVNDVTVNGDTVLDPGTKVANISLPTKISDLPNDSKYQTESQVNAKVAAAAVNEVNVAVDNTAPAGQPLAEKTFENGVLDITFKNVKGEKGDPLEWDDLTDIQKASLQGKQGDSAVFDPNTGNVLATLHNEIGGDDANSMTQKAITEKILPAVNGNINCPAVIADKCISQSGKASSASSTTGHGITDFIPLEEGCTGLHIVSGAWQNAWSARYIFFYSDASEEDEYCIDGVWYETNETEVINVDVVVPAGARYYRLTTKTTPDPAIVFYKGSLVKGLEALQADSVAKAAAISQNSEDIANVDAKADGILSYDEEVFTLTAEDGAISRNGVKGTLGTGFSSLPFQVYAGDTIFYHGYVSNLWAAIARVDVVEGQNVYTPLVIGIDAEARDYVYEVQENMTVVFSGYTKKLSLASAKRADIKNGYAKYLAEKFNDKNQADIEDILQCNVTTFTIERVQGPVMRNGNAGTASNGFSSAVFQLQAGDVFLYYGWASNLWSAIAKVEVVEGVTTYTPIFVGLGNFGNLYSLVTKEDMSVIVSGYTSKVADSWAKKIANASGNAVLYADAVAKAAAEGVQYQIDETKAAIESVRWDKPCPIGAFNNIVAVGDSLTSCVTYDGGGNTTPRTAYRRWAEHVQKKFGLDECLIFATGGHSSISNWNSYHEAKQGYNGPYRVPENGKTIVFIYLGTNGAVVGDWLDTSAPESDVDTFETSWADDYTGCYCKIVQTFLNLGAVVVLVLPRSGGDGASDGSDGVPSGWTLDDTCDSIIAIAERFGLAYVDARKIYSSDTIYHNFRNGERNSVHYTDFGYIYFAEKLIYEMTNLPKELMEKAVPR